MKKKLVLFCAFICQLFFVNASFAQSQDTFFGVEFGASKQEVVNAFKKQGLNNQPFEDERILIFEPTSSNKYFSFFKHDWEVVDVYLSESKFYAIEFYHSFKSKELALKNYESILLKLSSVYKMNEIPITDTERKENIFRIHFIYLEDLTQIYLSCTKDESDSGEMKYYVSLSYENTNYVSKDSETIVTVVEEPAMFPGGVEALIAFLSKNVTYPQEARETGTQGIVYVTFVVEKDGSISDIKILQDIGAGCGEEAVRVVKAMPKWIPAKHKGEKVRMQFNLPIKFSFAE